MFILLQRVVSVTFQCRNYIRKNFCSEHLHNKPAFLLVHPAYGFLKILLSLIMWTECSDNQLLQMSEASGVLYTISWLYGCAESIEVTRSIIYQHIQLSHSSGSLPNYTQTYFCLDNQYSKHIQLTYLNQHFQIKMKSL